MDQDPLFYDDEIDAIRDAVRILGGGKIVGPMLWPEKKPDIGSRSLADALNVNRAERLTPAQFMFVMRLARQKGYHGPWRWVCSEVGYKADPIDPEDEKTRLLRENKLLLERVIAAQERIARLEAADAPTSVRRIA